MRHLLIAKALIIALGGIKDTKIILIRPVANGYGGIREGRNHFMRMHAEQSYFARKIRIQGDDPPDGREIERGHGRLAGHARAVLITALSLALMLCAGFTSAGSASYLIGPGDVLEVSVWKDDMLNKDLLVRPDGMISFPLIGEVSAAGRTVEELRVEIQTRIKKYVPEAPVTVILKQLNSTRIYILGKVAHPGPYIMSQQVSVAQALAMAGGLTPFADANDLVIIRQTPEGQQVIPVNYEAFIRGKKPDGNIYLEANDTLVAK